MENPSNITNNGVTIYSFPLSHLIFSRTVKHVKNFSICYNSLIITLDSGTTLTMSGNITIFVKSSSFSSALNSVILGDGKTLIPVQGIGTIDFIVKGKCIILYDVLYVPRLDDTLLSIKTQMKFFGYHFTADNNKMILIYHQLSLEAYIEDEVILSIQCTPPNFTTPAHFNSIFAQIALPFEPTLDSIVISRG